MSVLYSLGHRGVYVKHQLLETARKFSQFLVGTNSQYNAVRKHETEKTIVQTLHLSAGKANSKCIVYANLLFPRELRKQRLDKIL